MKYVFIWVVWLFPLLSLGIILVSLTGGHRSIVYIFYTGIYSRFGASIHSVKERFFNFSPFVGSFVNLVATIVSSQLVFIFLFGDDIIHDLYWLSRVQLPLLIPVLVIPGLAHYFIDERFGQVTNNQNDAKKDGALIVDGKCSQEFNTSIPTQSQHSNFQSQLTETIQRRTSNLLNMVL